LKLRAATAADVRGMMNLERACPTAAHWTERQYLDLFQGTGGADRLAVVAEGADENAVSRLLGFLVARQVAPEWELENIVVAGVVRRRGVGWLLVSGLLARAKETHSEAVFLEVRESNAGARSLYEKAGFAQTGRRKNYYKDPVEDALVYRRSLP
jgi:ribosomal-protein-alanine acetyltransferase